MTTEKQKEEGSKLALAMLQVMESLSNVMDYEVELLNRHDYATLSGLRQEKVKLVRDYQLGINKLAANPDLFSQTEKGLRQKLQQEGRRLEDVSRRNAEGLSVAIRATQSLVQTVMDAARSQSQSNECYSDPRKSPLMLGSYSPTCMPVAVDRTA